jgi:hypothetical protein
MLGQTHIKPGTTILSSCVDMVFSIGLANHGSMPPIYSSGAPHQPPFTLPDSVETLSGYRLHMEHEVFVCYWKH